MISRKAWQDTRTRSLRSHAGPYDAQACQGLSQLEKLDRWSSIWEQRRKPNFFAIRSAHRTKSLYASLHPTHPERSLESSSHFSSVKKCFHKARQKRGSRHGSKTLPYTNSTNRNRERNTDGQLLWQRNLSHFFFLSFLPFTYKPVTCNCRLRSMRIVDWRKYTEAIKLDVRLESFKLAAPQQ